MAASKAGRLAERVRSRHLFVVDALGLTLASVVALALWMEAVPSWETAGPYLWIVGIIAATRLAVNIVMRLYAYSWRHASVPDMGRILAVVAVGSILAAAIVFTTTAIRTPHLPPAPGAVFWLLEASLALLVLASTRFAIRAATEMRAATPAAASRGGSRALLYGAGWAGVLVARSASREPDAGVVPVGFLDDDPDLAGRRVVGLRVYGDRSALGRAIRDTGATVLLITMPSAEGDAVRSAVEAALAAGLEVRTVPPVTDLLDGSLDASRIRQVNVEDLLRRPVATEHTPAVRDAFEGKTVVITGGAGSIGSELARQVIAVKPRHVALVDQAESPLYMIQRELTDKQAEREASGRPVATTISTHLVDITDGQVTRELFERLQPDVVLHAAAYKHVPMLEDHPDRAVTTNIGGTQSVVDAADAAGTPRVVLVSTDKAVWPSSVMGASKRVAEMIVADAARRLDRPYVSVRFGNVLGSNGSVVRVLQEQLQNGQPLTLTDPDMTRYFMTIPEAAWLIIDAAALANEGGLYVLDMGEPVRIADLAEDLIRLSGRDPESVPIKTIGLRPGEKMHEELFYDQERAIPTEVPKVLRSSLSEPPADVRRAVEGLLALADGEHEDVLRRALHDYVRGSVEAEEGRWRPVDDTADDTVAVPDVSDGERRAWVAVPVEQGTGVTTAERR